MTNARIGYGAQFYMQATSVAAVLTKLGEVTSIGLPNEQRGEAEATHFESPGQTREYIATLIDGGELPVTINWIPGDATDDLIVAAKASGSRLIMRTVVPGGQQFTYPGIVKGIEREMPIDDRMTATITIRVAGAVVQEEVFADPTDIEEA
ncbi:MAG: phage tail tube protein [Pseudomonadota bacterium]